MLTEKQVKARIKGLDDEAAKAVVCALVGHSRIQSCFFGYWHCGRCEAQIGDSLAGTYDGKDIVLIGHNCPTCRKNFDTLTWADKFMAPDPFKAEAVA